MALKLLAGALAFVVLAMVLQGWIFGGGSESTAGPLTRNSAIPTATMPASLPEPILLGQSQSQISQPTGPAGGSANSYTVKSGDTLGAIANSQGVTPDQQAAWVAEVSRLNGLDDPRLLRAGQELQLPRLPTQAARPTTPAGTPAAGATAVRTGTVSSGSGSTPSSGSTAATATPTPRPGTTPAAGGGGTYTIQSGDFPFAIAGKLGVPAAQQPAWVDQLVALNNINPSSLTVGQVLQLPAGTPGR